MNLKRNIYRVMKK